MIIVRHLNNARSQRILWLLEELGLQYEIKPYQRDKQTMLATPELRQAVMSIGGVEARHVTALDLALQALGQGDGPPFEDGAFYSAERAVPEDALLS